MSKQTEDRQDARAGRAELEEQVSSLPTRPGVYLFRDGRGEVLYVGKAKALRSRVRSYLRADAGSIKLTELARRIRSVETFVLETEAEALLLEWNLIKEHAPRFNIQLRDDKSYPYIKVTVGEPFPRIFVTRKLEEDGSRYFGPFTDVKAMRRALRTIKRMYTVRSCHYDMPDEMPPRPCLDYHIGRCKAPCAGYQSREDYRAMIDEILQVLGGHTGAVRETVEERMHEAAESLDFERAAEHRDVLRGLASIERRQTAVDFRGGDRDVVGLASADDEGLACGVLLRVREGRLMGREEHYLRNVAGESEGEVVGAFVKGFYLRQEDLPAELLVPDEFEDRELVEEYLSARRDGPFAVRVPHRGRKRRLVELAEENARHVLELDRVRRVEAGRGRGEGATGPADEGRARDAPAATPNGVPGPAAAPGGGRRGGRDPAVPGRPEADDRPASPPPEAARRLAEALGLAEPPRSLVCFDVSTLGGSESAGSAVWLADGRPVKEEYRHFRIRAAEVGRPDDYAAMQEVVGRYFGRRIKEAAALPDLVVVDGGRGQLSAARQALEAVGASDVPTVALAKREEEVFLPGESVPVRLHRADAALHWLQRARDEAHRFALRYNRTLRRRRTLRSRLSEVPGVGPEREQELLRRFGSLRAVRAASVEELCGTPGIGETTARRIRRVLDRADDSGADGGSVTGPEAEAGRSVAGPGAEAGGS